MNSNLRLFHWVLLNRLVILCFAFLGLKSFAQDSSLFQAQEIEWRLISESPEIRTPKNQFEIDSVFEGFTLVIYENDHVFFEDTIPYIPTTYHFSILSDSLNLKRGFKYTFHAVRTGDFFGEEIVDIVQLDSSNKIPTKHIRSIYTNIGCYPPFYITLSNDSLTGEQKADLNYFFHDSVAQSWIMNYQYCNGNYQAKLEVVLAHLKAIGLTPENLEIVLSYNPDLEQDLILFQVKYALLPNKH